MGSSSKRYAALQHHDACRAAGAYTGVRERRAAGDASEVEVVDVEIRISELLRIGQVLSCCAQLQSDALGNFDALDQVHVESESARSRERILAEVAKLARSGVHQNGGAIGRNGAESGEGAQRADQVGNAWVRNLSQAIEIDNSVADSLDFTAGDRSHNIRSERRRAGSPEVIDGVLSREC